MKDYQDIFFNKNSSSQIYKSSITCSVGVYMMNPKFLSRKLIKLYNELVEISTWNPLVTIVLVLLLRHQLLLLTSTSPLLPKTKAEETIPREKSAKVKVKKGCCHEGH